VLEQFPERTEADLYFWVAYQRERLRERYGYMPPDEEVATLLKERFRAARRPADQDSQRALRAAIRAAPNRPRAAASDPTGSGKLSSRHLKVPVALVAHLVKRVA